MISGLCAFCKRIFAESLPPSLAHNTPNMRFSTTEKTWLANEARYLFFTENGPVEIAFRPYKALKITGGLAGLIIMLIIAGPVLYKHLPEMMPERDMATDIAKVITAPVNQPVISSGSPLFSDTIDTLKELALRVSIPSPTQPDSPAPAISPALPENITDQANKPVPPSILPNNSTDTAAAQVLAQPSPVIEERPEDYVTALATPLPIQPSLVPEEVIIAPIPRPKAEKMDPEFVGMDSLAEAPYLDSRVQLHRLFADYLSQARQVERIIERFDIPLDNTPDSWPLAAEPADALVSELFLHRDSWIKVLNQLPLKSPLRYYYITSPYGMRTNKKTGVTRFHHGIDLAGTWRAELRPSASGVVSFAGRDGSFGKIVRVRHAHNIETVYAHLSAINVKTGDFVTDNVVIGKMGNTGRSDGMHLHYEILINNKSIDPALFFKIGHQLSNTGGLPRAITF
jgi:murein DD-endopeptidase MepM/ murein hydrolase activator NlpD